MTVVFSAMLLVAAIRTIARKQWDILALVVIAMAALVVMATSCTRYYTPERAAMTGGKTCHDHHVIR